MFKTIEIYIKCFAQVFADLFRFKIDMELSQLGFLSSIASEFENWFIHQSILKHNNGRYDFREKRMAFRIRHVENAQSLTLQILYN